jgi:ATP-dependent exoDNAse (exonuclease V) beta subunit
MGRLKIYRASAGSGKTHRLTEEYLKFVMSGKDTYRHVLAVTFTNKATEEMKNRILNRLHKLSESDQVARERLISILHDYSSFNISTIDKFFQMTLRAFARETGRNSSYGIELDDKMVIKEAVDRVINNLDKPGKEDLLDWLVDYSVSRVEESKGWDVRGIIEKKSENFSKEAFRMIRGDLLNRVNRPTLNSFRREIDKIVLDFERRLKDIASEAIRIMERHSLIPQDFKNGTRSPLTYFTKVLEGKRFDYTNSFASLNDSFDNWVSKKLSGSNNSLYNSICNAYDDGLRELVYNVVYPEHKWVEYRSAKLIKDEIYTLGMLLDISEEVKLYSRENNILLLSETNDLLSRIIDGSDAPFIYEKVGSRMDHFMLDEFQDTSKMQWENFRPLIENSLSQGYDNLLVGDVKQSIYRWRGSDWEILNKGVEGFFTGCDIVTSDLLDNWRSEEKIVKFNNNFFPYASRQCDILLESSDNMIGSIYEQVVQRVVQEHAGDKGHVSVKFTVSDPSVTWKEKVLEMLPCYMDKLVEAGYSFRDITFLVRSNDEGAEIVDWLIKNGYPVISSESLLINSSPAIRKIVAILRYFNNPHDSVNNTIAEFLGVIPERDAEIEQLPLYQMCETIIEKYLAGSSETDSAYLHCFLDTVLEFSTTKKPDVNSFLEWYGQFGETKSLSSPSDQDAVKVMTIHKAKGLSLEVVIIPFLELYLDQNNLFASYIWCRLDSAPFNMIPYLPVKYGSSMAGTVFAEDYLRERRMSFVDNLNLAYVAFTRAKRELLIFAPYPKHDGKAEGKISSVADLLFDYLKDRLDENGGYEEGRWCAAKVSKKNTDGKEEIPAGPAISLHLGDRLKLSLVSQELFDESNRRNYGLVMHNILSKIVVEEDLNDALDSSVTKGEIKTGDKEKILSLLQRYISSVRDRHWFDGTFRVFNEVEIIEPGNHLSRPDRVLEGDDHAYVIDFKFGLNRERSHITQVKKYIRLIKETGMENVVGYLWYPEDNEIVKIDG